MKIKWKFHYLRVIWLVFLWLIRSSYGLNSRLGIRNHATKLWKFNQNFIVLRVIWLVSLMIDFSYGYQQGRKCF